MAIFAQIQCHIDQANGVALFVRCGAVAACAVLKHEPIHLLTFKVAPAFCVKIRENVSTPEQKLHTAKRRKASHAVSIFPLLREERDRCACERSYGKG